MNKKLTVKCKRNNQFDRRFLLIIFLCSSLTWLSIFATSTGEWILSVPNIEMKNGLANSNTLLSSQCFPLSALSVCISTENTRKVFLHDSFQRGLSYVWRNDHFVWTSSQRETYKMEFFSIQLMSDNSKARNSEICNREIWIFTIFSSLKQWNLKLGTLYMSELIIYNHIPKLVW